MSSLRKTANGQPCMVRIPGICNWDNSTTVLAHINGAGMGIKANDIHAAFCCSSCHDVLDSRINTNYTRNETKLMHWEGIKRTQDYWLKNGLLKI